MLFTARLYASQQQAESAVADYIETGYSSDSVAMLTSAPAVDPATGEAPASVTDDREMAIRAGSFMGEHADFYVSRVKDGVCLVVAAPPFMASGKAEQVLDSYDPLPDSHLPPPKPFVPISEKATPFSDLLRLPLLSNPDTTFSGALGFGFKQEGLSHFSRIFKPLANDYVVFPMSTKSSKDTMFPMSTRSNRLQGKDSSFGFRLLSKASTPFSAIFGLPLLTTRKLFLTDPDPDAPLPPPKPFVPVSEQAAPFSEMLGLRVLAKSDTPFSNFFGLGFKQEGLSHFSRMMKPLSNDTVFPMGTSTSKDTMFPMSTKSNRLEGKGSSFGMGLSSKSGAPFSSMLGLPLLTKRKHFLTS